MCSYITEQVEISGSGTGTKGWFPLRQANVYYDHPFHAPLDHALTIDFLNGALGPGARVAVELSAESAMGLVEKIHATVGTGEGQQEGAQPEMCTGIIETAEILGSGKGSKGWLTLQHANVYYDQPSHAPLEAALNIDFLNATAGHAGRIAVELSVESARGLVQKVNAALESGRREHIL